MDQLYLACMGFLDLLCLLFIFLLLLLFHFLQLHVIPFGHFFDEVPLTLLEVADLSPCLLQAVEIPLADLFNMGVPKTMILCLLFSFPDALHTSKNTLTW